MGIYEGSPRLHHAAASFTATHKTPGLRLALQPRPPISIFLMLISGWTRNDGALVGITIGIHNPVNLMLEHALLIPASSARELSGRNFACVPLL